MPTSEIINLNVHHGTYPEHWQLKRPETIDELLQNRRLPRSGGELLDFGTPPEVDVYNSSAPIWYDGKWLVAVREEVGGEFSSQIPFFSLGSDDRFHREPNISNLSDPDLSEKWICQDPASAHIHNNLVITQVEVDPECLNRAAQAVCYHTGIYAGKELDSLKLVSTSPNGMKGVRLVELKDGRVGVFTRPQYPGDQSRGGLGKVGFTVFESLEQINIDALAAAPLVPELFSGEDEEWGGVNDALLLPNGDLAVLGHIARYEKSEIKHSRGYYPISFTFNPFDRQVDNLRILATVGDFEIKGQVKPKKPYLENIFYPSYLSFPDNNIRSDYAMLVGGIKDSKMAAIYISNPYTGWLENHP